jgi:phage tail P2-like protein
VKTLSTTNLTDLLPSPLSGDETVQDICTALDPGLQQLTGILMQAAIIHSISVLPESVLDILGHDFHIDEYRDEYSIEQKRSLIQNCMPVHKKRGTPGAVRSVTQSIFGGSASVQEWFEYAGDPYHFRLKSSAPMTDSSQYARLAAALEYVKNVRSVLDGLIIDRTVEQPMFVAVTLIRTKQRGM